MLVFKKGTFLEVSFVEVRKNNKQDYHIGLPWHTNRAIHTIAKAKRSTKRRVNTFLV